MLVCKTTMNEQLKKEKERMTKYGGIIFNLRTMGKDSKLVLEYDEGYNSNQYDFNVDNGQSLRYLQECEKALSDVPMRFMRLDGFNYYTLVFGAGQPSEPLIDRLLGVIAQNKSVMKGQIEKYRAIYLEGFSDRMLHFLSEAGEGDELGRHIINTIGQEVF
jgi:hypothetical protein